MFDLDFIALLAFITSLGIIGNSYAFYAHQRGWPVGRSFNNRTRPTGVVGASVIFVPFSFAWGWYARDIWTALIGLVAGFFLAYLLTNILRQWVQAYWFAGMAGVLVFIAGRASNLF